MAKAIQSQKQETKMLTFANHAVKSLNFNGAKVMLCILALYLIWAGMPVEIWLDVKSIHVEDSPKGSSPRMVVDRKINSDFHGEWIVELERQGISGFYVVDKAIGENSYNEDDEMPEPLHLDWWTHPTQWRPSEGRYRIETCWTIKTSFIKERETCKISNTFKVY